ncbi:MAG: HAD family hydrolase [Planctomycetes bacterium]|nr:HAD family hydrolase [Planctomycetota bacterium]
MAAPHASDHSARAAPPTLLLFDIDGTILKSGGAGMRAMYRVAERMFGEDHKWDGINPAGNLDPQIFAEFVALNRIERGHDHHQRFHDHYVDELRREFEASHHLVRVMPGIHEVFTLLHHRARHRGDVVLGLLTGNYTRAVPIKLGAVGVDVSWFTVTAYGDEGRTRPDLMPVALHKFHRLTGLPADRRRVIVIGDTPRDVECAHAHGCVALAVATGGHGVEELTAAGADVVVRDLADPSPLLALIDRA